MDLDEAFRKAPELNHTLYIPFVLPSLSVPISLLFSLYCLSYCVIPSFWEKASLGALVEWVEDRLWVPSFPTLFNDYVTKHEQHWGDPPSGFLYLPIYFLICGYHETMCSI